MGDRNANGVGREKTAYSRQFFGSLYVRKDFLFSIPHAQDLFMFY